MPSPQFISFNHRRTSISFIEDEAKQSLTLVSIKVLEIFKKPKPYELLFSYQLISFLRCQSFAP